MISLRRVVTVTQSLSRMPCAFGESRMDFDSGFRILIHQRSDSSSLGAGQILADDPAGRQVNRIVVIDRISGLSIVRD